MAKASTVQRSFSLGETREDFLERDDLDLRRQSCRILKNARVLATEAVENRPGTYFMVEKADVRQKIPFTPETGTSFGILIFDDKIVIIDETGADVADFTSVPWTDGNAVWTAIFSRQIIFGSEELYALEYDEGTWTWGAVVFDGRPGNEIAQPYWSFNPGTTITPSALTGSITVTASASVFVAAHVGKRIRYLNKEIEITAFTSATEVDGDVIRPLPPSLDLTMASVSGFAIGEAVVGSTSNWQGVIVGISGSVLQCVTTSNYSGPTASETISGPNASATLSSKANASAPYGTTIWDEPLISEIHGYPQSGAAVKGRLVLCNFPKIPDLVAIASTRAINDFDVGANDDDAIVRQVGNDGQRFLHAVPAVDLLLLSDRGLYVVKTRDGEILTPSNFEAVRFDERSANTVKPALVDDAVVFVEGSGATVSACVLSGNVYLEWSVLPLSRLHSHLIKTPVRLCGPALRSQITEKYMFVVNSDGTIAAMSWVSEFGADTVGFIPWETQGQFRDVAPLFGGYWVTVDRSSALGSTRYIERFDYTAVMDCVKTVDPYADHLPGVLVGKWSNDFYAGQEVSAADGSLADIPSTGAEVQVGLEFDTEVQPWPIEMVESRRVGMVRARLVRVSASVQNTVSFKCRRNNTDALVQAYNVGDDLSQPPSRKTAVYRFIVFGNRDHPEVTFVRDEPGPFRLLSIGQEVSY